MRETTRLSWKHKITPIAEAKKIIASNPDCLIEVSYGSRMGYHIQNGSTVLCRISKSTFHALNDGGTEKQPPFINRATFKVKNITQPQK